MLFVFPLLRKFKFECLFNNFQLCSWNVIREFASNIRRPIVLGDELLIKLTMEFKYCVSGECAFVPRWVITIREIRNREACTSDPAETGERIGRAARVSRTAGWLVQITQIGFRVWIRTPLCSEHLLILLMYLLIRLGMHVRSNARDVMSHLRFIIAFLAAGYALYLSFLVLPPPILYPRA